MLLSELITKYLGWLRFGRPTPATEQTIETETKVTRWLLGYMGDCIVEEIDRHRINDLRKTMLSCGKTLINLKKHLVTLRSLLKFALLELDLEVMDRRDIELPKCAFRKVDYLSLEELEVVMGSFDTRTLCGARMASFTVLILDSGMRLSEILALNRNMVKCGDNRKSIIGKGRKQGWIFFHDWSINTLEKYLAFRKDDHEALFVNHDDHGEMKRCTPSGIDQFFYRLSKRLGIEVTPHKLRRTAATFFRRNGGDLLDVQGFLRHQFLSTTQHYMGVDIDLLQRAHAKNVHYGGIVENIHMKMLTSR